MTFTPVIHRRETWQDPDEPVVSSSLFEWFDVDRGMGHYTAAEDLPDGDPGENTLQIPQYLRNIQHWYLTRPGDNFSIGYSWAIDYLGGIWELRGWDYECAANKAVNQTSFAILFLVDGDDPAGFLMAQSARWLRKEANRLRGTRLPFYGHRDFDGGTGTPCPGEGVYPQIQADHFNPDLLDNEPEPEPEPEPTPEPEEDMKTIYIGKHKNSEDEVTIWGGDGSVRSKLTEHDVAVMIWQEASGTTVQIRSATNPDKKITDANRLPNIDWPVVRWLGAELSRNAS